jgi:hypothetical protein
MLAVLFPRRVIKPQNKVSGPASTRIKDTKVDLQKPVQIPLTPADDHRPAAPAASPRNGSARGKDGQVSFTPSSKSPVQVEEPVIRLPGLSVWERPVQAEKPAAVPSPVQQPEKTEDPKVPAERKFQSASAANQEREQVPSLGRLLSRFADLPEQTAVIGVCEDGLPVLLDLHDPSPGSLLVIGDEAERQRDLLRAAVASLAWRVPPSSAQFIVFSVQPDEWWRWIVARGFDRHCLAVEYAEADSVQDLILRMADWTEQRRLGQRSGPPVLLIADSLSFLPDLEDDVRLNFEWLAHEGPPAQIWPLAAISSEQAAALGPRMLRAFQGSVLGYMRQPDCYTRFAELPKTEAERFGRPGQFAFRLEDGWLWFRSPQVK